MHEFGPRYAGNANLGGDKTKILMDSLKELTFLLEAFGAHKHAKLD